MALFGVLHFTQKSALWRHVHIQLKGSTAVSTSPLPTRVPTLRPTIKREAAKKAADLESMAQLIEHSLPNFKRKQDRLFYRNVVEIYRTAAREVLRRVWVDDKGQDIAEYAVMLAVILVIVTPVIILPAKCN